MAELTLDAKTLFFSVLAYKALGTGIQAEM
jgi:hypothetical protein